MRLLPARTALCAAAVAISLVPAADAFAGADSARTTFLLSRSLSGGLPNGPSRNGAVSHDQRIARVMAYESEASDIVQGDTNGATDVFIVRRATPWGQNGTEWKIGTTEIASAAPGGAPANGRSYRPTLDGSSHAQPSCVAFVSEASNLVPGDTNGKADAFVRDLNSGRVERVSVDSKGRQSNGASYEVAVDGDCERVAFVSDASNLALGKSKNKAWGSAKTSRTGLGVKQVYVHIRKGKKHDKGFKGMTFLASASDKGKAGSRHSYDVSFARAGKAVVFTSEAANLDKGDSSATPDVYERTFVRQYKRIGGKGVQALTFDTRLVSAKSNGRSGNGASTNPSVSDDGVYIAFETLASDLLPGDSNGVSDVAEANLKGKRVKQQWVSRSGFSGIGNGASNRPVISGAGEFVLFDSEATNLKPSASVKDDPNGVRDVFLWNRPSGNVSLESRDSDNGYIASASQNAATSSRGNYVPFESANPLIDLPLAPVLAPVGDTLAIPALTDPDALAGTAATDGNPALLQVYVRYLGPK